MNAEDKLMQELIDRAGRPECPDHVVANIMHAVDAEEHKRRTLLNRIRPQRLVWIGAAAAAVLLIALLPDRFSLHETQQPTTLTAAEVEAVRAEVETAFAIISRSMERSQRIVDDQIRENVTGQLIRGLRAGSRTPAASSPAAEDDSQSSLIVAPSGNC